MVAWFASRNAVAQMPTSDATATESEQPLVELGASTVIVHSKFGGQIFGFDIDQNGTEGVLSESQYVGGGLFHVAVETFDQKTGTIIKVIKDITTKDDFVTLGVVGHGVGLVEREHVQGIYVLKRIYNVMNPLDKNAFTGLWTPPLGTDSKHISSSPPASAAAREFRMLPCLSKIIPAASRLRCFHPMWQLTRSDPS
jgi:hypothetical protein